MLTVEAESDAHSEAADSMLQHLHGSAALLELRTTIVTKMAMEASSRDNQWTLAEWSERIGSIPFDRHAMNDAIRIWREEVFSLEMSENTRQKMKNAATHGERHEIERKAFRAWQKEKYGHATLAKVLLKFPVTNLQGSFLGNLLEEWQAYIQTDLYQEQRTRHAPRDQRQQAACAPPAFEHANSSMQQHEAPPLDPQGGQESPATACSPPVVAPITGRGSTQWKQLQDLRELRKAATKGKADPETMEWFHSGALDEKLAELTLAHGSGRYYDTDGNTVDLRPHAFEDFLASKPPRDTPGT
jgi:hypothetical protein